MRIKITAGRIVQTTSISCESRICLFVSWVVTIAPMI